MLSMANMANQMELFDEGGLMQEGGTVDPVSGNDVPVGSTQEEVRDDIPAQLSEGEFVMPADVVRYHGLDKMMALRDEAKMGLQRMEDMGQMGNSEEATIPDGVPFNLNDLDMEDDGLEMAQGGAVPMPGFTGISGYTPPAPVTTGFAPAPVNTGFAPAPVVQQPVAAASSAQQTQAGTLPGTQFIPTTVQQALPTFQGTVGMGVSGVDYEEVEYINDAGQIIKLKRSKSTGELLEPVPPGFRLKTDAVDSTQTGPTTVQTTQVSDGDGGDNQDFGRGTSLTTGEKIAGYSPEEIKTGVASAKDRYAVTGNRGIDLLNFLPGGQFLKSLLGTDDKPSTGLFSNTPEAMPTGFTDSEGNMIPSASADYMKNLGGLPSTDTMTETTRTSGSPLPNMNVLPASAPTVRNLQNLRGMLGVSPTRYVGFNKGDLDPNSGGFFDKNGVAIDPETGGAARNEVGTMNYASFEDFKNAIAAGTKAGWRGGVISSKQYSGLSAKGKANYDKFADLTKNRKGGGVSVKEIAKENKAKADKAAAEQAAAEAKASRDRLAEIQRQQYSDNDGGYEGESAADAYGGSGVEDAAEGSGAQDFSSGLSHAKGGLVSQMKRSGLASKK